MSHYGIDRSIVTNHSQYEALVTTGVGAHHAGQLLMWRLLLEELMSSGLLRIMVATGTVAAGVDFPARTVIVTAHSKRGAEGFRNLSAAEFQQMSGRAGRRGKDVVGFCLVAPGPFSDARVIHEVAQRPPEPLTSAYFASPSTILNLLKFRSVDDLQHTVDRSLASFLDRKHARAQRETAANQQEWLSTQATLKPEAMKRSEKRIRRSLREADELDARQRTLLHQVLGGLERLGYTQQGALTEKGLWAAHLCTNLVLELGEALSDFLFEDLSVQILVGLVASIAGDPHRHYLSIRKNPIPKELYDNLAACLDRVREAFQGERALEVEVVPDAAVTALTWMESSHWNEFAGLLRLAGVAEGDASRLIMQTAEHLGQIARLFETHPTIARTAAEGKRLLLKPPLSETVLVD